MAQAVGGETNRVLVTGANGNLGRRLIRRLFANPASAVRAVVRSDRAAATLGDLPEAIRPETVVLDYADAEALATAAKGCRFAVHLVGIIKESATSRYTAAHEDATRALAIAAERAGLRRVVYLSILGSRADSRNPCLASKGRAEEILLAGGVPALILRVPMVLGPGDAASRLLRGRATSRSARLIRGGASLEQPIAADDVVSAMVNGMIRPGLDDAVLELAGPESLPDRELVMRAAALFGNEPRVTSVPLFLVRLFAFLMERVSANPPLTSAMLGVIQHDDDLDPGPACERLGIVLTPLDEALRRCVGPEAETS